MNLEIKGVHLEVNDRIRDYIDKKLDRLDFAKDYMMDLLLTLTQEKSNYRLEANINFRWGNSNHIGLASYDIYEGVDKLIDKIELKINKEKNKIQHHKGRDSVRTQETA